MEQAELKNTGRKPAASVRKKDVDIKKLEILITVVPRAKGEYYTDFFSTHGVSLQMGVLGIGTATAQTAHLLGLEDNKKTVIFSVTDDEKLPDLLTELETALKRTRTKGAAFSVPMSSVIGATIYNFLCNNQSALLEKRNERQNKRL